MTAYRSTYLTCNGPTQGITCTADGPTLAATINAPFEGATIAEVRQYAAGRGWLWTPPNTDTCPTCRNDPAARAAREAAAAGLKAALTDIRTKQENTP